MRLDLAAGEGGKAENVLIEIVFQRGKFIGSLLGERLRICNAKCPLKGLHALDQVMLQETFAAVSFAICICLYIITYIHILNHLQP